jgi:3,4-dihydroxy 2-butanone 4-phosphate synthase/GTP cyclohydrolase II
MTNNPRKVDDLEANQIQVIERVAHQVPARPENRSYLETKVKKLNHILAIETPQ